MKKFKEIVGASGKVESIETGLYGKLLLTTPELNKGSAFTKKERIEFQLIGKLPCHIETLEEQVVRYYEEYRSLPNDLIKNKYLSRIRQSSHIAFFALVSSHLEEMMPIVYTPTIGEAVKRYSYQFDTPSGMHFSYPDINKDNIDGMLQSISYPEVDIVVVTDGEGILGIGDWGAGGMDICIGKSMVYTLCAGVNPRRILPVHIDVGTNNKQLLNDPMYLGWRSPRIVGKEYEDFVDLVVNSILRHFPNVLLHWEDFSVANSRRILKKYRNKLCTFNDDVQGTGATALASIFSALMITRSKLVEQRFIIFGAGTAGVGVADQLVYALIQDGLSEEEARACFWLVDKNGLLVDGMEDLFDYQDPYKRSKDDFNDINQGKPVTLLDLVHYVKPTVLIGCSAVAGAFSRDVVEAMSSYVSIPIILPLSNPTSRSEVAPQNAYDWTEGRVIIATGSPFENVEYNDRSIKISQCNNAFIFPGLGLGVLACGSSRITDYMLMKAAYALAECSPLLHDPNDSLLPSFNQSAAVGRHVALAVALAAIEEGFAQSVGIDELKEKIEEMFWHPSYLPYMYNNKSLFSEDDL